MARGICLHTTICMFTITVLYTIFQIFVKDNQGGEDTTVINHIGLFGTPRDITKADLVSAI